MSQSQQYPNVGFLGLGLMGNGMARRLLSAGVPLTVFNRTQSKAEPLVQAGARLGRTPAEVARNSQVVFSMVSDNETSRALWLGEDGALAGANAGTVLVECSTLTPSWIEELDRAAQQKKCILLDAPVTGSKPQAEAGQLFFLVGGSEETVREVKPLFDLMGRGSVRLGGVGSGARMKLINNFLCGVQAASLAEAVGLIERSAMDMPKAIEILGEGAPGSPLLKALSTRMLQRTYEPNFVARLMAKDLRYALQLGESLGQALPTATAALEDYDSVIASGRGEADLSVVAELYRKSTE